MGDMGRADSSAEGPRSAESAPPKVTDVSGHRWALMRHAWRIQRDGETYLTRWRLIQTPWFGVYLHRFDAPDPDEHLHDHPWNFTTFVLRGGYMEWVPHPTSPGTLCKYVGARQTINHRYYRQKLRLKLEHRTNSHRAEDRHRIMNLWRVPTWTLFFVGQRRREWGFWVDEQFVPWRTYLGLEDAA